MAQDERSSDDTSASMTMPVAGMAAMQGMANTMMRGNMEMVSLASRRARATLDMAKEMGNSHSAAEIGQLGTQFWNNAFQDFMQSNHNLMSLWMQGMTAAGQAGFAHTASEFVARATEPMEAAASQVGAEMVEHPTEPWAWWRTDVKSLRPHRNGSPEAGASTSH